MEITVYVVWNRWGLLMNITASQTVGCKKFVELFVIELLLKQRAASLSHGVLKVLEHCVCCHAVLDHYVSVVSTSRPLSPPPLDWPLPSHFDRFELKLEIQPKSYHRAHYETEGSRGSIKSAEGHPVVKVNVPFPSYLHPHFSFHT